MAIQTFNDGDNLGAIRTKSLNPTIELANKLDSDLAKLSNNIPKALTPNDVFDMFDRGEVPKGTSSLTGLDSGWWFVPASLTTVSSRPPGVEGDFIFYKQIVTGDTGSPRNGVIIAYGYSTVGTVSNVPTIWTRYKLAGRWTPWTSGGREIQDLVTEIARVKAKIPSFTEIEQHLIDAGWHKNGDSVKPVTKVIPTIYAKYSNIGPTTLSGVVSSKNGELTVTRSDTTASRIIVWLDNAEADRVGTIQVDGGLASNWISRTTTIDGKTYKVYYSSGAYTETSNTVKVNFD